ncbi:hypothetical protein FGG90_01760 [Clavibacter tessellarius]|uniref:Integral membrane protein n=1 Tax=Clavibacter tessellarius TaxID=31965 RepID=A0A225CR75_9MICO|nr:hypothetical protein [Clavibacter michiganensis]OQJ64202.1 hypothetical protein B5P24_14960 [Clavibacter michiganensis subsp. tessellarius]UKF32829.1 hypothetical protein FGG90_01760 [Clavibacter michiganensis subsp. tessellarius]
MADGALTRPSRRPAPRELVADARSTRVPWWVAVLGVYLASRVLTTVLMLVSAQSQIRTPWAPASPSYLQYATFWDAGWYRDIATFGYPTVLPVDAAGHVQSNPWAFMPVYPGLVRAIQDVTGAPFDVAGVAVSLVAGAGAVLVLHRLLSRSLSPSATMTAVVIVCVAPVSPMFQIAYAESLQTLLLLTALLLLFERRYAMLAPVAVVMALTRPLGLAFALALLLHGVHRLATARRDPFPPGERARLVLATTAAGAAGAAWPVVAWIRTGSITAYTDTELSWRAAYVGYRHLVPFEAWFDAGDFWIGGVAGTVAVLGVVAAFVLILTRPSVRALGPELRIWVASYGLYLLAVFFPQSSVFRLLLPMIPLAGALAVPRSRAYRVAVVLAMVVGQWLWIDLVWRATAGDWTPP